MKVTRKELGEARHLVANYERRPWRSRLTEERVRQIIQEGKPGWYSDGRGLYIQIPTTSWRSYWFFLYYINNRLHHMSLGPTTFSMFAEAREVANAYWRLYKAGFDPRKERDRIRKRDCDADFMSDWSRYQQFQHLLAVSHGGVFR